MPWAKPVSAASIWPVWLSSLSMACLPRITSCGCSLSTTAFSAFGHGQDGAVGTRCQGGAQLLLDGARADQRGESGVAGLGGAGIEVFKERLQDGRTRNAAAGDHIRLIRGVTQLDGELTDSVMAANRGHKPVGVPNVQANMPRAA